MGLPPADFESAVSTISPLRLTSSFISTNGTNRQVLILLVVEKRVFYMGIILPPGHVSG